MHIIKSSKLFIQNFTLSTALQSPLERVAFPTFRLPLKYRFSLNQAKRMSPFRRRFDQLLYEHFYDALGLQHFFFLGCYFFLQHLHHLIVLLRAERQSALRHHGLLSLIGRLLCFFLFQLGLLLKPRAFFLALTTAEPLTCHLRQQPHPLTVMRSRRAVMSLGQFTDSLHLRCSASQLVHEMRRPRNFQ